MKYILLVLIGFLLPAANSFGQSKQSGEKNAATGPIVEMEPYVVKDSRILPPPEQWSYVKVPALVLRRGNRDVVAPGYELISNLNASQTKVFVNELQLRQFASIFIWPMLTQALPKAPVYVVADINQQYSGFLGKLPKPGDVWAGDRIDSPATTFTGAGFTGTPDFASASQHAFEDEYGIAHTEAEPGESDEEEEADQLASSEGIYKKIMEAAAADQDVIKPLPDGFVKLAANGGPIAALVKAGAPFADAARPSEERFAATLSYQLNVFALYSLERKPPPWFARGLGSLLGSTQVSQKQIQFALVREKFTGIEMPNLITIFQKKDDERFTVEETMLASVFVHYALYADGGKYAQPFMTFVDRLARGEAPTEALFKDVFHSKMRSMENALSSHVRNFAQYKSMDIKGAIPPMPAPTFHDATQSEVARIKSEMYVSQNRSDLALSELRIAYWRGEREPALLALLASLELQIGTETRGRKIIKSLMSEPKPPPQAFIAVARLQMKDTLAAKPEGAKLTEQETSAMVSTLTGALAGGVTTEDLCATLAEIILKSDKAPDANIAAFLLQASKRYPQNQIIAQSCKTASNSAAGS